MKKCTICESEKPYSEFHRQRGRRDGYGDWCKPCKSERKRQQYQANPHKARAYMAAYRAANPEKVAEAKKAARLKKLDEYKAKEARNYRKNRDKILAYSKEYRRKNWPMVLAKNTRYKRERLRADPLYRMQYSMRCRIFQAFRAQGYAKGGKTSKLLGCDWDELMQHMAAQFQHGMTLDNYGEWHVDHIIPVSSAKDADELTRLCHYSNLQPLWAADNLSKGSQMPDDMKEAA